MQSVSCMSQKHEASTYGCDYDAGQVGPPTRAPSKSLDPDLDPPSRYVHDGDVESGGEYMGVEDALLASSSSPARSRGRV